MAKTHEEVVLQYDAQLLEALRTRNVTELLRLVDRDLVFTNEFGQTSYRATAVPYHTDEFNYRTIEVRRKEVKVFLTLGIVNSLERRVFELSGMVTDRRLRFNRIWKFDGRDWKLISATATSMD